MNARDFCFWLQGHFEFNPNLQALDEAQTELLKRHLDMVFTHEITPSFGAPEHIEALDQDHHPKKSTWVDPPKSITIPTVVGPKTILLC